MCTVTYIPKADNNFILTSNRDETPKRQPNGLFKDITKRLLYPKEPSKGGTWICVGQQNRLLCLLNGAFIKHLPQPPYRKSRGVMVLDYFHHSTVEDFLKNYNLEGIEPFTLIVCEEGRLYELRWDEQQKHFKILDASKAHIWSSSTLYSKEIKAMRECWFYDWYKEKMEIKDGEILNFHQTAGNGNAENDLMMYRNNGLVQTVSITQYNSRLNQMIYLDLISHTQSQDYIL